MPLNIEEADIKKFIMVGDRVLIKPKSPAGKTQSGLYLPPTVQENEKVQSGYVVKCGPGFPIPSMTDDEETWKETKETRYIPLQAKIGDLAVYMHKSGIDIEFNKEKYIIIPHSSIMMLIRDEELFA